MNLPQVIADLEKKFDKVFDGYWRGHAVPDEFKFFIKNEVISAVLEGVREEIEQLKSKERPMGGNGVFYESGYEEAIESLKRLLSESLQAIQKK